jgi:hypothetical protein
VESSGGTAESADDDSTSSGCSASLTARSPSVAAAGRRADGRARRKP